MKKLFFSAVALVAFSSVSMGNTLEVSLTDELSIQPREIDCVAVAIAALDAADPNNTMTQAQANAFYQAQYNDCEKSKKSLSIN